MEVSHSAGGGKSRTDQVLEIDLDDLLGMVEVDRGDDGLTSKEWQDATGLSERKTRQMLQVGVERGKLKAGKRIIPASEHYSGRMVTKIVYRVVR